MGRKFARRHVHWGGFGLVLLAGFEPGAVVADGGAPVGVSGEQSKNRISQVCGFWRIRLPECQHQRGGDGQQQQ